MALAKRQDLEGRRVSDRQEAGPRCPDPVRAGRSSRATGSRTSGRARRTRTTPSRMASSTSFQTGRVKAYHLSDPENTAKPFRVSAADIIHGFKILRPNQPPGDLAFCAQACSWRKTSRTRWTPSSTPANMAAKYLALVKTADPAFARRPWRHHRRPPARQIEELENAIIGVSASTAREGRGAHQQSPARLQLPAPSSSLILTMFFDRPPACLRNALRQLPRA